MHGKNVGKMFLGALFWVPILFKQYQNTSECGRIQFFLEKLYTHDVMYLVSV